jgi:hypothetical protein
MFESFRSFTEYVLDYEQQRSEGLLLRHLNSVYKVLSQTVPDADKTDEVLDMEQYLGTLLRQVDSSLADEWERMRDPNYQPLQGSAARAEARPPGADAAALDVTKDTRRFTAAIRAQIFLFLRAWARGDQAAALATLGDEASPAEPERDAATPAADTRPEDAGPEAWTEARLQELADGYRAARGALRVDPEARNQRHTYVTPSEDGRSWRVQQMLVDDEMVNDWVAEFEVDLAASREAARPVTTLLRIAPLA